MTLVLILVCAALGVLGAGIPIFLMFRKMGRQEQQALEKARQRAGSAKIEIDGVMARVDPTSPNAKSGCLLLTDENFIYVGESGGEIFIPRKSITKVEIATPILGSEAHGDTLLVSHEPDRGDAELLRISVDDGQRWLRALQP